MDNIRVRHWKFMEHNLNLCWTIIMYTLVYVHTHACTCTCVHVLHTSAASLQSGWKLYDNDDRHLLCGEEEHGRKDDRTFIIFVRMQTFTVLCVTWSPQETISTCRFAQRVALVKNEALLNEELDPKLVKCRDTFYLYDCSCTCWCRWWLGWSSRYRSWRMS